MDDYRERLRVPLAWWLLAMPSALILGATLYAGLAEPWPVIIMGALVAACAALLITLGLGTVEIRDGTLRAGNAALPLTAVSEVVCLDEKQTSQLRGPRADPSAHLYSRPYLKESVYLVVAPPRPGRPVLAGRYQAPGGTGRRRRKVPSAGSGPNQWHDGASEGRGRGDKEAVGWLIRRPRGKQTSARRS